MEKCGSRVLLLNDAHRKLLSSIIVLLIAMSFTDLLFLLASHSEDLTFVEGVIAQDKTWTLNESPYVVTGDIIVANGTTLTIEPAVEIRFDGNFSLTINGSLYAAGSNDSWITFTSNSLSPSTGDWNTIKFAGPSNESLTMKSCIVEYARSGITIQSLGKAIIEDSAIVNNSFSGIHVVAKSNLIIKENIIRLNENGISSSGNVSSGMKILNNTVDSNQNGIYLLTSDSDTTRIRNVTISGNVFSNNQNGVQFKAFPRNWGTINNVTIAQNTVNSNTNGISLYIWGGSAMAYATNSIYDTKISENIVYSNEKYGIYVNCSGPWFGQIFQVSISSNKIVSNENGIHLYANTHNSHVEFDVLISNNTISTNMDKGIYVHGGVSRPTEEGIRTNIKHNSISYNAYGTFYEGDTDNTAHFNDIYHNTYGMFVSNGATANATQNYWGAPTGPFHNSLNAEGKGNPVNGDGTDLVFKPFLTSAIVNKRPSAVLEADKTEATLNQIVTFNASKSSDDGHITSYFFNFGDGTNSSWIIQQSKVHNYNSSGTYTASLKVLDDLGFESHNTASVTIKVQPSLNVVIDADSETIRSSEESIITIRVTDDLNPISGANVSLLSDTGGSFSRQTGETSSTGHFVSVFTAPQVAEQMVITITVKASKTGYWDDQDSLELNVLPKTETIGIDSIVLPAIALIVILIFLVFRLLRTEKQMRTRAQKAGSR